MCGLPGSGKSTLARSLLDSSVVLDKEGEGGDVRGRSVLIDYDVLARDLAAATNEGDVASPPQPEQEERPQRVLSLFDQSDLDSWRQSRRLALSSLETELKSHFNNVGDGDAAAEGVASLHSHLLVVLDDNFHLRSMRREVHRVCQRVVSSWGEWGGEFRGHGAIGFSVLYVDTPLTVCLERNSHRRGKERVRRSSSWPSPSKSPRARPSPHLRKRKVCDPITLEGLRRAPSTSNPEETGMGRGAVVATTLPMPTLFRTASCARCVTSLSLPLRSAPSVTRMSCGRSVGVPGRIVCTGPTSSSGPWWLVWEGPIGASGGPQTTPGGSSWKS